MGVYKVVRSSVTNKDFLVVAASGYYEATEPDPRGDGVTWALRTDGTHTCIAGCRSLNMRIIGPGGEDKDSRRMTMNWDGATFHGLSVTASVMYCPNYASASDATLKENIDPLTGALASLHSIQSVRYCWKEEAFSKVPLPGDNTCRHIGFLAQEVQAQFPPRGGGSRQQH
jgi:hypothetical protein